MKHFVKVVQYYEIFTIVQIIYKCYIFYRTYVPAPELWKDESPMSKTEYITEINNLLNLADEELLDFVFQLLQKSINPSALQTQSAWYLPFVQG